MNILGICTEGPQSTGACLLIDGKLIAMAEEERFVRIKQAPGLLPTRASQYCLKAGGLKLSDIDAIAVSWDVAKYTDFMPRFYDEVGRRYGDKGWLTYISEKQILQRFQPNYVQHRITASLIKGADRSQMRPIRYVGHHKTHAAAAFWSSGYDEATIITIDASGEEQCTVIWHGKGMEITQIESFDIPDSTGWMYAGLTEFLGFRPYSDEGSVMGLACYGAYDPEIAAVFDRMAPLSPDGAYRIDPSYFFFGEHTYGDRYTDKLVHELGLPFKYGDEITSRQQNIAWAVQDRLEQIAVGLARRAVVQTGCRTLCLAGGVALNCKMNRVILDSGAVDRIFIQPVSNDAGSALGAAQLVAAEMGDDPRFEQRLVHYGPDYSNTEIKAVLDGHKLKYEYLPNGRLERRAAARMAQGAIVGWFQGRLEAGPRALGSRSIIASPIGAEVKDKINEAVKYREPWRPFAPSVKAERIGDFVQDPVEAPFMILTFDVRPEVADQIAAVVHVDNTVRPQTVRAEDLPRWYRVIDEFEKLTGVPMILNTSFNVKGEPIVNTPQDAVRTFYGSGLDALAIGDFWLEK
ncbi:carbamoyltransferase [Candidatus Amarolinea aalborgensis]|uniref:carbamoyltransferase family protein n=1 Tax=Candidatus Amarolinea aalborgensis TaxID=2249329 RepID=UPI003BF9DF80